MNKSRIILKGDQSKLFWERNNLPNMNYLGGQ